MGPVAGARPAGPSRAGHRHGPRPDRHEALRARAPLLPVHVQADRRGRLQPPGPDRRVQTICHFTRCAMGQVWLPAGGVLGCSPTWYCSGYGFEKLHAASVQVSYKLGQGLPGLAWAKGQPLQLDDIRDTGRFDRAVAAQRAGVREAMAVPVTGAEGVVAVLELFVTHERAGEPGRLERIARVAEELGPLVERRRASEALAASRSGSRR
ncbi:MAG TPA: GAF domain-containing protein [Actinomycetota bacterium]|nr:GAF domain-containing protein [Actinomycetota bacterium]